MWFILSYSSTKYKFILVLVAFILITIQVMVMENGTEMGDLQMDTVLLQLLVMGHHLPQATELHHLLVMGRRHRHLVMEHRETVIKFNSRNFHFLFSFNSYQLYTALQVLGNGLDNSPHRTVLPPSVVLFSTTLMYT